jgi:C_GCAxxG_C_C family probable redox protein
MASIDEGKQNITRREFIMASSAISATVLLSRLGMAIQPSQEVVMNELDEKVKKYLALSGKCSQTSFLALQEQFGLDGTIVKALNPFPGIAFRCETCGAVVGSLMALGLVYGREKLDDLSGYAAAIGPSQRFCRSFEEEVGSTMCGNIMESEFGRRFNLADPDEFAEFQASGALEKCTAVAQKGVRIAAEIVLERVGSTLN